MRLEDWDLELFIWNCSLEEGKGNGLVSSSYQF